MEENDVKSSRIDAVVENALNVLKLLKVNQDAIIEDFIRSKFQEIRF